MAARPTVDDKLYADGKGNKLSLRDLLEYFGAHGPMRVSDLHLKVNCPPAYRADGALRKSEGAPLDEATVHAFAEAVLSAEDFAELKTCRAVDSSLVNDRNAFRLNVFYDREGLCIAARALEPHPPAVESVGFPNNVWKDIVEREFGLVLVTGITGAGKSTTIASLIERIAQTHACRIITLEDPVEYRLQSDKSLISQRELGRDVPNYEHGLRDCLREDPDVIFVGEMRDTESAAWTLTAAETGHLVFSTLHTRDVRGSITRILNMFPPEQQDEVANQLSLGLSHIISQKLVPRADGTGRVVAMEIMRNTYACANMIRMRKVEQMYNILQTQTRDLPEERMTTMERSLAMLVKARTVTIQDAERYSNQPSALHDEMADRRLPPAGYQASRARG
jgi:twitching motility protein PilT